MDHSLSGYEHFGEKEETMPIAIADIGEKRVIVRIGGSERIKKHLNNLGFIEGEEIMVVNRIGDSVIVKLKGVSLAITSDLAKKIFV